MKKFLFGAAILSLGFQSVALADDLYCKLNVNGHVVQDSSSTKSRELVVGLGKYACSALVKGNTLKAYLFIPVLHTDQDIIEGSNNTGAAIYLELPGHPVSCVCGIE